MAGGSSHRVSRKSKKDKPEIELIPKTENQSEYIKALRSKSQVIALGPAGTGKSYIAATHAAKLYSDEIIDKIVITRPHVAIGRDPGAFPGNPIEKALPWAAPIIDTLCKHLGRNVVMDRLHNKDIEVAPLQMIRGRSFDNAIIILDEAQNTTMHEMKALVTRVGEGSQLIMDGDIEQVDLRGESGLAGIVHLVKKHDMDIPVIEFTLEDCVRSRICKEWLRVFKKEGI